ncbi:hypothetical protein [Sandaracinus amylolyticus]|uniref:hypothetical protein n=1 Tax=Sandaracinus amylolyticus TaxID=927083 RepID=UPI001F1A65A0|nr:hypothetical protein [Sandaracinus amylolyticus]UJR80287.1 Hypothetical protein I5071_23310 [Sandaracinus amylolyticus]
MARRDRLLEVHVGPFGELTKRRDALARALRDEGDTAGAARVKALKKPPISAWAVTQLIATETIDALLEAGDAARGALGAVLGGADPATLRARMDALREAIDTLTTRAAAIVEGETGRTPGDAVMSRVADDLRALALSPDGRARVGRGFLEEDLAPPGLDALGAVPMPTTPVARLRTREAAARRTSETHQRVVEAQRRRDDARREQEAARREARRAAAEARARSAKERALRAEAENLAREADRAEKLAREARRRADEARRALERLS